MNADFRTLISDFSCIHSLHPPADDPAFFIEGKKGNEGEILQFYLRPTISNQKSKITSRESARVKATPLSRRSSLSRTRQQSAVATTCNFRRCALASRSPHSLRAFVDFLL